MKNPYTIIGLDQVFKEDIKSVVSPLVKDIYSMIDLCEHFLVNEGLIATIVSKLASYVVTDIVTDVKDREAANKIIDILDRNRILEMLVHFNAVVLGYGNLFLSVMKPFTRVLRCKKCGFEDKIARFRVVTISARYEIVGICEKCKQRTVFDVQDIIQTNKTYIFKIWDPRDIVIDVDPIGHKNRYILKVPKQIINRIKRYSATPIPTTLNINPQMVYKFGEIKAFLETLDLNFLKAIKHKKGILFAPGEVLHVRRIGNFAFWESVWGLPIHAAALEDLIAYSILKRYRNYLARERTIPLRFVYPQISGEIIKLLDLKTHASNVIKAFEQWARNKSTIHYIPIPVGMLNLGAEGAMINLEPMIQSLEQKIIMSCNVPQEFVYGGISSWTGSSIALRMLENHLRFLLNIDARILNYIKDKIALIEGVYEELKDIKLRLASPRTVDDIAKQRIMLELNQRNLLSDSTLLKELGVDPDKEHENTISDFRKRAERQVEFMKAELEVKKEAAKYQVESQIELQTLQKQLLAAHGIEFEKFTQLPQEAQALVYRLLSMKPSERMFALSMLQQQFPVLYNHILPILDQLIQQQQQQSEQPQEQPETQQGGTEQSGKTPAEAPLPEQRPPRREEKPV